MQVSQVIRDIPDTIRQLVNALANRLHAEDNFAPDGIEGQVLTSRGPDYAPNWQDATGGGGTGATGPIGATGATGSTGATGADGADGADGAMGPPGLDGLDGEIGPEGPPGPAGVDGTAGAIGATGPMGPPGLDGVDGDVGPEGVPGPMGLTGATGATGPEGPMGPPGMDGLDGEEGPMGPEGEQGSDGDGSTNISDEEVNLGSVARRAGEFQLTGASGLTPGNRVFIQQAPGPYTGKGTRMDEAEMDQVVASCVVLDATTIQCYWNSFNKVRGNIRFNYVVSQ